MNAAENHDEGLSTPRARALTIVSVSKPKTPRTIEELRAIYADEPDQAIRLTVERLWFAVEAAESRGIRKSHIELEATSNGHLSHVFAGRRRKLDLETLRAYAKATGVREAWLIHGDGSMSGTANAAERVVEYDARYPNLSAAILFARGDGIPEEAIKRVQAELHSMDEDPSPRAWLRRLEDEAIAVRREALASPLDVEREAAAKERDAARAKEMEAITKPKLPKRKR
jgi:hypothetical protein